MSLVIAAEVGESSASTGVVLAEMNRAGRPVQYRVEAAWCLVRPALDVSMFEGEVLSGSRPQVVFQQPPSPTVHDQVHCRQA